MVRTVLRYSEAFKFQVVSELESGKLANVGEARRRYGIGGKETVKAWVRRYGKNRLLARVVRVETPDEKCEIERLRMKVREMERALAETHMDGLLDRAYLKAICESHGLDLEAEKKSAGAKLLSMHSETPPGRGA